ncbi:MAG: hypothetical protein HZC55_04220 [Verrucomicrobia bacterium]|nr:hypothetical protein [Verrucomicrobiota bacterium]
MSATKVSKLRLALWDFAADIDMNAELTSSQRADCSELVRVLARIVDGRYIGSAFGAPGDWGYGTPIGDGLLAWLKMQQEAAAPRLGEPIAGKECETIEWHYLPELPDDEIRVLIALENDDSDEPLYGFHADGLWYDDARTVINRVYAWAHGPANPAKKGGAS